MILELKTTEKGWAVQRHIELELPDEAKTAQSILRVIENAKKPTQVKPPMAADPEPQELPDPEPEPESLPEDLKPEEPEEENPPEEKPKHPEKARGFVLLECDHCRSQHAFSTKYAMQKFTCNSCGRTTELRDLVEATFKCPGCHKRWHYTTNSLEPDVSCKCVECGTEMTAWWNDKSKCYESR